MEMGTSVNEVNPKKRENGKVLDLRKNGMWKDWLKRRRKQPDGREYASLYPLRCSSSAGIIAPLGTESPVKDSTSTLDLYKLEPLNSIDVSANIVSSHVYSHSRFA